MKVIFLDMDGVMVTPRACIAVGDKGIASYLDPIAVSMINSLCDDSGAKIVISSSWRGWMDVSAMRAILGAAGINQEHFFHDSTNKKDAGFFTPKVTTLGTTRGHQISDWISDYHLGLETYLILDDDSDMLPEQKKHFVKTDVYNGITHQNFIDARQILGIK